MTTWMAALAVGVVLAQTVHQSPFVCNVSALTREERARHRTITATLAGRTRTARAVENGYEFAFPGNRETVRLLGEWIEMERLCCPFFDIELRLACERGDAMLRLTGKDGTKAFIEVDLGRWVK